ncbi:Hsp20/alpha crystallin family protein [Chroococcidiopsis sp. TS-821]|uniref:Hsp20/alpha crystallin family protein n=1 Tax=Chroococcidiopsis sp. TS-821 TaxID=1378066 RepID=UPI000CED7FC4|nr:Hsp20/alpha crystallin family protein [Chroococcidiopsis sp. TS-821]PPS43161.1 molecular chaperone [Chroococcidiopsis sp. TS-821]
MALVHWQPFQEINALRRQMDRMFDELAGFNRELKGSWMPAIEMQDREAHIILRAELPGVDPKDLDVQVARDTVTITGETRRDQEVEDRGFWQSEFRYGKFQRTISLPVAVENERVEASYKDGILTLTLPKVAEAINRVVHVNLTGDKAAIAGSDSIHTTVDVTSESETQNKS